ncbi:hypothetical protein T3H00_13020 [Pseudomonas fluorescens]|uniref:hypothetical protein n=1 Tax=Pseudomonas fluorescens TaxID=294 RepID=UPI002ACACF3E|nr:hypothetical protein [Pseudomonas fluorescens]MDZ5433577.1 hypothetical protein [Pseudomonas fluorescens]
MSSEKKTRVIYGDAPFIDDMGALTTLCLLNDEVLLFGSKSLAEHLDDHWEKRDASGASTTRSVAEEMLEVLLPEGVISFYSPSDAITAFPGACSVELPGINGFRVADVNGTERVVVDIDKPKLNDLSRMVLGGFTKGSTRTLSSILRDSSVLSVSMKASIPIVCSQNQISLAPSRSRVSEVSAFLAQRTFQRLALPELEAFHPDDILEARKRLKDELLEFRAGILELVWLLHQKTDIGGDLRTLSRECDILIDTKISASVSQLERAIAAHESKKVRRILKVTGGALLELGKSFLTPSLAGALLDASGAALKIAEGMEARAPSMQIASFVYKVREKRF